MNLFTAIVLSTQHIAQSNVPEIIGFLTTRPGYQLKVEALDTPGEHETQYRFMTFRITYPDARPGKGWGDPKVAECSHYTKDFSESDLIAFLEKSLLTLDNWQPVENE